MHDKIFIENIEESIRYLGEFEKSQNRGDFGDWENRFLRETEKLVNKNLKVREEDLMNFRGKQLFVADRPSAFLKDFYNASPVYYKIKTFLNFFLGTQRGGIQEALDAFDVLEKEGFLDLLAKYPTPDIGNPLKIQHRGYSFTNRYIRHIYLYGLFDRHLKVMLPKNSVIMDIGSSYGIFSSIIKQERKDSHHVLVDLSGQLILAHYYLGKLFPRAKIAGFKEVGHAGRINRAFIEQYDFILIPTSMYQMIEGNSVDLVTNFISLSEMSRCWFNTYIWSEVFKTAPFLFVVNRYDAYPTYQNNITILDYHLENYDPILMRTCPFLQCYYRSFLLLGYKRVNYPSQFFQFIGSQAKSEEMEKWKSDQHQRMLEKI